MFHQPRQTSEEVGDIFQQGNIGISAGVIGDNLWLELLNHRVEGEQGRKNTEAALSCGEAALALRGVTPHVECRPEGRAWETHAREY